MRYWILAIILLAILDISDNIGVSAILLAVLATLAQNSATFLATSTNGAIFR